MNESKPYISFILPAFNEENNIGKAIQSIHEGGMSFLYEVIVVDHNSTDNTAAIAKNLSAKVVKKIGGTISSVRNYGVENSVGNVLVFLDSDVTLTHQWFQHIDNVIKELIKNPNVITGSHCNAPEESGNWIERYWFNNYVHESGSTNLGTGHMILMRELFDRVGGFDQSLKTGEDYELCMKVTKQDGKIINNPDLRVVHHDYPGNLKEFVCREAWHGEGDVGSLKRIFLSKVAVAALIFASLHVIQIVMLFIPNVSIFLRCLPMGGIFCLVIFSSFKKFRHCKLRVVLINSVIFYFYFLGRAISFLPIKWRCR